jgi:hypothetical protein
MEDIERRRRLEHLCADHSAAVRAYAARRVAQDVVDDVASDVFVVAWRRLEDVPEDPLPGSWRARGESSPINAAAPAAEQLYANAWLTSRLLRACSRVRMQSSGKDWRRSAPAIVRCCCWWPGRGLTRGEPRS